MSKQGKASGGFPGRNDEKNQEKRKHNKDSTIQNRNHQNVYENRHNERHRYGELRPPDENAALLND